MTDTLLVVRPAKTEECKTRHALSKCDVCGFNIMNIIINVENPINLYGAHNAYTSTRNKIL
jgi:hypothetical protein